MLFLIVYIMENYKRYLCQYFGKTCVSEDSIYEHIKDDSDCICNLNEDGKLHSNYTGSYYEPALIATDGNNAALYWFFDGKIKDCNHPFRIVLINGKLSCIEYYSSERIQTRQPLFITYENKICTVKTYNICYCPSIDKFIKIFNSSYEYDTLMDYSPDNDYDESLFTSKYYPLCDPLDIWGGLKFVD